MDMKNAFFLMLVTGTTVMVGCKPRTTAEKIENKVEDATHETKQGMERAGDRIKDATK